MLKFNTNAAVSEIFIVFNEAPPICLLDDNDTLGTSGKLAAKRFQHSRAFEGGITRFRQRAGAGS